MRALRCGTCVHRACDGACGIELQTCDVRAFSAMPTYSENHLCHMDGGERAEKLERATRVWEPWEDNVLRGYYVERGPKWCATALKRSESSITHRTHILGLKRRWNMRYKTDSSQVGYGSYRDPALQPPDRYGGACADCQHWHSDDGGNTGYCTSWQMETPADEMHEWEECWEMWTH